MKFLSIVSVCLVCLNLFLIWFFMFHKRPTPSREEPKVYIIDKLGFDKEQVKDYEALITWHKSTIRTTNQAMRQLKNELYTSLQDSTKLNVVADSLIAEIGKLQVKIETTHYKHFNDIKKLCKPKQQKAFNELTLELSKLFSHQPPPPHER